MKRKTFSSLSTKNQRSILLKYIVPIIMLIIILIIAFVLMSPSQTNTSESDETILVNNEEVKVAEDGTKYILDPNKIKSGGPPKGGIGVERGIPALAEKNIKFVTVEEADEWIADNELVLALIHNGVKRVYPLQILVWHEIANDKIKGEPILITYCPLCGSGIAYESYVSIDGVKTESRFGTSGKLYNSNLIMYDEKTDTYWQQIDGKAIVGPLVPQELKEISIDTVTWRDWKKAHPDSEVLSQDTGMNRNYGRDPYGNYYEDSFLLFPVENEDDRIHAKTQVFGIEVNGKYKAYKEDDLKDNPIIEDKVNGVNIKLERLEDGRVIITNQDNGDEIVKEVDFWFAWYAFHPDTELYEA
jgi:hypothetical protein